MSEVEKSLKDWPIELTVHIVTEGAMLGFRFDFEGETYGGWSRDPSEGMEGLPEEKFVLARKLVLGAAMGDYARLRQAKLEKKS